MHIDIILDAATFSGKNHLFKKKLPQVLVATTGLLKAAFIKSGEHRIGLFA